VNEAVTKEERKKEKRKSFLNPLLSHRGTDLATLMREKSAFCEPKRRWKRDQPTNGQPNLGLLGMIPHPCFTTCRETELPQPPLQPPKIKEAFFSF
jgi:hypothetical protein